MEFLEHIWSCPTRTKNEFLVELAHFCSKNNQPYLIGGDFNIIRFSSDKNKPSVVHKHTYLFNNIISIYELLDIHLVGGKYIWSNNQENPTLERLDRVLISKQWEDLFPSVFLYKLPREIFDHNPLILSTQTHQYEKNLLQIRDLLAEGP